MQLTGLFYSGFSFYQLDLPLTKRWKVFFLFQKLSCCSTLTPSYCCWIMWKNYKENQPSHDLWHFSKYQEVTVISHLLHCQTRCDREKIVHSLHLQTCWQTLLFCVNCNLISCSSFKCKTRYYTKTFMFTGRAIGGASTKGCGSLSDNNGLNVKTLTLWV